MKLRLAAALTFCLATHAHAQADVRNERLAEAATFNGVRCAPTGRAHAEFHPSGRLAGCPLAADTAIASHALPAGTWIYLTDAGALRAAWLPRDLNLAGHVCRGTGYKGWSVTFHPDGSLKSCFLAHEEEISGVRCRKASFWGEVSGGVTVALHPNGTLASCGAARDVRIGSVQFKRRSRVQLDAQGRPIPHG